MKNQLKSSPLAAVMLALFVLSISLTQMNTFSRFISHATDNDKEQLEEREEAREVEETEESEDEEKEERESGADKQLSAWFQSRAYPDPTNLNQKYEAAWLQAQAMRNNQLTRGTNTQAGSWTAIGPKTGIGGRVLSISINKLRSNSLFIGTASGGVWKSYDGAANWQPVITNTATLGVSSVVINPVDTMVIYAGTGEVYRVDTSNIGHNVWKARGTYGVGILKSTNAGATWSRVFTKATDDMWAVQMLKLDPTTPTTVYACATDGLYRSTLSGANGSWTRILAKTYVNDVAIDPTNSNNIVVTVGNLVNIDKGIYKSTNGGTSFVKITSGLPASYKGMIRLDNVGAANMVASIGIDDATTNNELYRSTNFGTSWTALASSNHADYQYWFSHEVAINPSNTDKLVAFGVTGFTYTVSTQARGSIAGSPHADVHGIVFDPNDATKVYMATDGGVWRSTNSGSTFASANNGLYAVQFYASLAVSPSTTNPNVFVGGLQDNGVIAYNGTAWSNQFGGDGGPCVFSPANANVIYASNDARGVKKSTTGVSGTWNQTLASWAFNADDRTGFMAPIAISKSNPNHVYVASDNLHSTVNAGTSWTNAAYGTATNYIEMRFKTAIALAVAPTHENDVWVSTSPFSQRVDDALNINGEPNVLKSTNGGTTFVSKKNNLPNRFVMDFAISATNRDSVFVAVAGFDAGHIWVTGNGGDTWVQRDAGLPNAPINALLIDPVDARILYAGGDEGVYVSTDRGLTWSDFSTGLWDATQVMDIQATAVNGLVIATHGKGVFTGPRFSGTLPLNTLTLTGKAATAGNELAWITDDEPTTLHYQLERSADGISYQKVTQQSPTNTGVQKTFRYTDKDFAGTETYYRVKATGRDGSVDYSGVVVLRNSRSEGLTVFTSPFSSSLQWQLKLSASTLLNIRLYNAGGQVVQSERVNATGTLYQHTSYTSYLAAGTYILEVTDGRKRFTKKIVKQ